MSEDNTRLARQLFYALRVAELTQQAKDMAAVLDPELFFPVRQLRARLDQAGEMVVELLESTRKLMN